MKGTAEACASPLGDVVAKTTVFRVSKNERNFSFGSSACFDVVEDEPPVACIVKFRYVFTRDGYESKEGRIVRDVETKSKLFRCEESAEWEQYELETEERKGENGGANAAPNAFLAYNRGLNILKATRRLGG